MTVCSCILSSETPVEPSFHDGVTVLLGRPMVEKLFTCSTLLYVLIRNVLLLHFIGASKTNILQALDLHYSLGDSSFEGLLHCPVLCRGSLQLNFLKSFTVSHVIPVQGESEVRLVASNFCAFTLHRMPCASTIIPATSFFSRL